MPLPPADPLCPLQAPPEALRSILHANVHRAFLSAISRFDPAESPMAKAPFARALRAITPHNGVSGMTRHSSVKMRNMRLSIFSR